LENLPNTTPSSPLSIFQKEAHTSGFVNANPMLGLKDKVRLEINEMIRRKYQTDNSDLNILIENL
jgi:hypothetical protein